MSKEKTGRTRVDEWICDVCHWLVIQQKTEKKRLC